jgi:hypothetical protein
VDRWRRFAGFPIKWLGWAITNTSACDLEQQEIPQFWEWQMRACASLALGVSIFNLSTSASCRCVTWFTMIWSTREMSNLVYMYVLLEHFLNFRAREKTGRQVERRFCGVLCSQERSSLFDIVQLNLPFGCRYSVLKVLRTEYDLILWRTEKTRMTSPCVNSPPLDQILRGP